jgi:hypothetical protein
LTNAKVLCIGPITNQEAAGIESDFCDGFGMYLYLADASDLSRDVEVIARVVSEEAAKRLRAALVGKFMPRAQKVPA